MTPAELDIIASAAERRWGIGRLPLLVPADLAAKFDKMRQMHRDGGHTPQLVSGMARAWQALDAAATAAGAAEAASLTWEAAPPQFGVADDPDRPWYILGDAAICADQAHVRRVQAAANVLGVTVDLWTPFEFVHVAVTRNPIMIESMLADCRVTAKIMAAWPDAVVSVRPKAGRLPVDAIPFGDAAA